MSHSNQYQPKRSSKLRDIVLISVGSLVAFFLLVGGCSAILGPTEPATAPPVTSQAPVEPTPAPEPTATPELTQPSPEPAAPSPAAPTQAPAPTTAAPEPSAPVKTAAQEVTLKELQSYYRTLTPDAQAEIKAMWAMVKGDADLEAIVVEGFMEGFNSSEQFYVSNMVTRQFLNWTLTQ